MIMDRKSQVMVIVMALVATSALLLASARIQDANVKYANALANDRYGVIFDNSRNDTVIIKRSFWNKTLAEKSAELWIKSEGDQYINFDIYEYNRPQALATMFIDHDFVRYSEFDCNTHKVKNQPILGTYDNSWIGFKMLYNNSTQLVDMFINRGEGFEPAVVDACLGHSNANADEIWIESGGSSTGEFYIEGVVID